VEIAKPSDLIDSTTSHEAGRSLVVSIEGSRALFYEIQSLVVPTVLPVPRRVVSGIDFNRLQLLLAVMRKHMGISLDTSDIYVSVVGGLTAKTPAADLGIVASIASSIGNSVLPEKTAFIGEIGLLGEIRGIYGQKKIIQDSERFGLDKIYSSEDVSSVKYLKKLIVKHGKS
jgi:DNA repair protein RadA/Sms